MSETTARRCTAVLVLLVFSLTSCELRKKSDLSEVQAVLDNAASGLEAEHAQVVSEVYYGDAREWAIILVPDKANEDSAVVPVSTPVVAELERTASSLDRGQYLLAATEGQPAEIRILPANRFRVDKKFVVTGKGLLTVVARIVPDAAGPPRLVSFELSERR